MEKGYIFSILKQLDPKNILHAPKRDLLIIDRAEVKVYLNGAFSPPVVVCFETVKLVEANLRHTAPPSTPYPQKRWEGRTSKVLSTVNGAR